MWSRNPASDTNLKNGFVGCAYGFNTDCTKPYYDYIEEAKAVGEGWVDLRSSPFEKRSGIITNFQILTLEVKKCAGFSYEQQ